jgi:hypothetical protein
MQSEETRRTMHRARVGKDLMGKVSRTLESAARFGKPSTVLETDSIEEMECLYLVDWLKFEGYELSFDSGAHRIRVIWSY